MKQKDFVIKALSENGGIATLSELYRLTDTSTWRTKTPFASIRGILQTNKEFFRIKPGLWGLSEQKDKISKQILSDDEKFTHSYYQGIIANIGNLRKFNTFIPAQDKNRLFVDKKLGSIATTSVIYDFSYQEILKYAKTIDVIWFNERRMPSAFFEVEHSTNIKNSLNKFYELQDFRADFFIVADIRRLSEFKDTLKMSIYKPIQSLVKFSSYENIVKIYEQESQKIELGI